MKIRRCIALVPSCVHKSLWLPCARPVPQGRHDRFCARHREALDGAMLGLHANGYTDEQPACVPKRCLRRQVQDQRGRRAFAACSHVSAKH
jgi:hypothetical protein